MPTLEHMTEDAATPPAKPRAGKLGFYRLVSRAGLVIDDVKLCNCASCRIELLGDSMRPFYQGLTEEQQELCPPLVAGRAFDRPYCPTCWRTQFRPARINEKQE